MRCSKLYLAAALLAAPTVQAGTIHFASDPFAGSNALTTPGRQIVGGELFTPFSIASDVFLFHPAFFAVGSGLTVVNDVIDNVPASGANVIVLQTFDNDADPATPFGAGTAANLIAGRIAVPTPGFFIYFNSGLDLPRLVYSTDLSDETADLKILARLTNLTGQAGRDVMPSFSAANFAVTQVPEPSSLLLMAGAGLLGAGSRVFRRKRPARPAGRQS